MLNGLDLFSGIGGIALALAPWVRPVAYCEIDRYAQSVLLSRMADGSLPCAPVWDDVKSLGYAQFDVPIDIITGGFPCQDISTAGPGGGLDGERSGLFFEIVRLARELRPRFIFLENVPAITFPASGGWRVVGELAALGYDARWCVISAASVGACHIRERWFLLAHAPEIGWGQGGPESPLCQRETGPDGIREHAAHADGDQHQNGSHAQRGPSAEELPSDTDGQRQGRAGASGAQGWHEPADVFADIGGAGFPPPQQPGEPGAPKHPFFTGAAASERDWWAAEPDVVRMAYGVPHRVDRVKGLGNSVVPLQARTAFEILAGIKGVR